VTGYGYGHWIGTFDAYRPIRTPRTTRVHVPGRLAGGVVALSNEDTVSRENVLTTVR
jgi:hypothetical protein